MNGMSRYWSLISGGGVRPRGRLWPAAGLAVVVLLLLGSSLAPAATLTVAGSPRQVSTLQQSYPAYACMNPVASGGAGSYHWDFTSNPGSHFTIDATYGTVTPVAPLTAGSYPITVRVTDGASATATLSVTVSVVSTPVIALSTDTIFDNYNGSSWFCSLGILASGFNDNATNTTWTLTDPSNHFGIAGGYNTMTLTNGTPAAGDYPITLSLVQNGNNLGPFNVTMHVVHAQQITSITYTQNTVSTSQGAGVVVGTASTTVWEPGYQWSIPSSGSDGGTFTILNPATGVVTLTKTPTLGNRNITIQVQDGLNVYSQGFTVNVVAGTTVPPGNMTMTVASNLDNFTTSGSVGTPSVSSGITGTKAWSFTGEGVGYRYAINATTGQVTVIGALSYQPTMDGVDYSDVLYITCTDGVNTCTNSFKIPVAAVVGPTLNVGPGQTYAHLDDAISYIRNTYWISSDPAVQRQGAGVIFNIYPSSDPNYYLNDGQYYPVNGVFPVPVTIQGAPGQTFPKFCGGSLYYGKGFFMGYNFDLWVKNVEICNVTDGANVSGNDNEAGITKEAGCPTGNMFVDNCYVHDCQDCISRGHTNTKWFITNTRVSHGGVGETGYTHNIYIMGELGYFKNVLSDQSSIGHVLKSRCKSTIINNCRLYDGLTGHGSCDIDIPEGGVDTVTNSVFHKGPNYQNPQAVHFADAGDSHCGWPSNQLTVSGSTFYGDAWIPSNLIAVRDVSLVGTGDGLPASVTMTSNSFYGYQAGNYEITVGGGATSVTGSVTLTAQAAQDWSFPGPGPDPTVAHPPGPFLAPYGVVNGAQMTFPVNEIRLDSASPIGTSVVNPTFLPGKFSVPSPVWSLRKNPSNRYAINASTGAITTAAALIPGMVDVVEIQVSQSGVNFGQVFTAGGPTYSDHPADGSFIHSISIAATGNLPTMYTITPSAGTGGTISPSSAVQVAQGGSQTFTITANNGYTIGNVLVDGTSVGAVSTYTFTNVQANHTISATFNTGPTYTITASAGVGGTISPNGAVQVSQGGSQTFTISANTNYTIANVTVDGTGVGAVSTYTFTNVQANHTIAATFNSTLGSVVKILKSGTGINMTYTTNLDPLFQNAGASNVVQVTCDDTEMTTNTNADYALNGTGTSVAASSDYGYLVKWDVSSIPTGATVSKAQIRLYANNGNNSSVYVSPILTHNWTQATATVAGPNNPTSPSKTWGPSSNAIFSSADLGTISTFSGAAVPVANPVVVDVTSDLQAIVNGTKSNYGWAFVGGTTFDQSTIIGNHAYFTQDNADATTHPALFVCYTAGYTITASAGTGGTISPSGSVQVSSGGSQTFTITPNSGYVISSVLVDGSSVGAVSTYTFNNVTAAHTISAAFTPVYTITASAGTGGTITPSGAVQVNSGGSQTFTIAANSGYAINSVLVDGSSVGAVSTYTFSNVTANHTISATFSQVYTITASASTGGTISPSGAVQVTSGGSQTFTITANTGNAIADVKVDGTSVGAVSTYTFNNVTANHTIAATFSVIQIFKSGAGINMTYKTNLDSSFQNAGSSNVVQVTCDDSEMSCNPVADWTLNGTAANVSASADYGYLVKWDLSSIPSGATITKAQIRLYSTNGNNGSVYVSPILTHNWTQATATVAGPNNPTNPSKTWGPSSNAIFGSADLGTITTFSGAAVPVANPVVVDVTSDLQAIVNGTKSNYGWAFVGGTTFTQSTTIGNHAYYTQDNSDATTHPALFINYHN